MTSPAQTAAEAARPVAPRVFKSRLTDAERERHAAFVGTLKTPIWAEYIGDAENPTPVEV